MCDYPAIVELVRWGEEGLLSHQAGKLEWDTCRVAFLRDQR